MSTGSKLTRWSGALFLCAATLCIGVPPYAHGSPTQTHRKTKKKTPAPPPPLPSGPTGPVQQMPLDTIAAVPPQVTFQNNELTIVAPNSTLADILRAVRKQTGADIEVPAAPERVVTHLGPAPAREVLADLLNGSRFNYVLLGSPGNETLLTRVVLVAKPPQQQQQQVTSNAPSPEPQQGVQPPMPTPDQDQSAQAVDTDTGDESAPDENAEQPAPEPDQSQASPDQPNIKTPQQMLQEMQQRQIMMQQGQQPGSGMPPHPPQQQ
jgi:hypothetical protein